MTDLRQILRIGRTMAVVKIVFRSLKRRCYANQFLLFFQQNIMQSHSPDGVRCVVSINNRFARRRRLVLSTVLACLQCTVAKGVCILFDLRQKQRYRKNCILWRPFWKSKMTALSVSAQMPTLIFWSPMISRFQKCTGLLISKNFERKYIVNLGPDLQNILRQSYDYLTTMRKLRS